MDAVHTDGARTFYIVQSIVDEDAVLGRDPGAVAEQVENAGIDQHLTQTTDVTEALVRAGVADYTRASTRLTAVLADVTQALHLHLREGNPLLRSTSVNSDAVGHPVEYGRTWFAGDRVTLTLET